MISSHQQRLIEELQENLATVNILLVRLQKARSLAEHPKEQLSLDEQIKEAKTHKLEYENALRAVGVDPNEQQIERANPYKGLAFFRFEDRANFFGRERVSQALRELVEKFHFVALIGASGSGKSSVLQAGLRGVLAGEWLVLSCRPSMCPFAELSYAIAPLCYDGMEREEALEKLPEKLALGDIGLATLLESTRRKQDKARLLLIIDQFEELFTQNTEAVQKKFTESLQKLLLQVDRQHLPLTVLLSYRADFTEFVIRFFGERLNQTGSVFLLGKMSRAELQTAIEQPAYQAGVQLEEGLLTRILEDVSEKEGLLPLLQFALAALWDKQEALCLTHQAYAAIGGIEQALANYADNVLTKFDNKQQEDVRRIFMQLVRFGEGTEDTRQVTTQARIHDWQLVAKLADERLVVTQQAGEQGTAELVHEALIRHWQPLRQWIEADRKFRVWQENLRRYIQDKVLLQGVQLGIAQEWLKERGVELLAEERAFIEASIAGKEQREARRKRQQRLWTLMIFTFFVVALGLSILAGWKWVESEKNLGQAQQKSIEAEERFKQSKLNQSRMLAGLAEIELNNSYPATAMRLVLEALPNFSETYPDRPFVAEIYSILNQAMNEQYHGTFEHDTGVKQAVFSPNNKTLLTVAGNTVYIWDIESRQVAHALIQHTETITSANYSPDGSRIVTASDDKTAKVWDAKTGKLLLTLDGHTEAVVSVNYSPDSSQIVTASADKTAKLWDSKTGKLLLTLDGHTDAVVSANYSPDGSRIVTASDDKTAKVWDAKTGKLLLALNEHTSFVWSANYSSDGSQIVTASDDGIAEIWDAKTGKLLFSLDGHTDSILSVNYSPDGLQIITASDDKTAKVWNAKTGKLLFPIDNGHTDRIWSANYSSDGLRIVTASTDTTAKVWNAKTGKLLFPIDNGHTDNILSVNYSPDGSQIVTTSYDNTAKVWDVNTRKLLLSLDGYTDDVVSANYSPDGARIVIALADKTAKILNAKTKKLLFSLEGHTDVVNAVHYSPDSLQIVTASADNTAKIWDTKTGKLLLSLDGHTDHIWSANYSPDSLRIVTASDDNTAKVWDAKTGKLLLSLDGGTTAVWSANYSPDGLQIVTTSSSEALVWDAKTGKLLLSLDGHMADVISANYNLDGSQIVTASHDKTAKIWDAKTGQLIITIPHDEIVFAAKYSPDGKHITTLTKNNIIQTWLNFQTTEETIEYAKKMLPPRQSTDPRDAGIENFRLTCEERQQFFLDEIERCKAKP